MLLGWWTHCRRIAPLLRQNIEKGHVPPLSKAMGCAIGSSPLCSIRFGSRIPRIQFQHWSEEWASWGVHGHDGGGRCRKCHVGLYAYVVKEGYFGHPMVLSLVKDMSAQQWWIAHRGEYPELQKVTKRVLSMLSTSCACDRKWSEFDSVH